MVDTIALEGAINVRLFGAAGNGTSADGASFAQADAAGSSLLIPAGAYLIAASLTIVSPIQFQEGARLIIPTGVTVTLNGTVSAPLTQIFSLTGSGTVVFNQAATMVAYPEWWGALPNSPGIDCQPAIQSAINALPITQLQVGAYYIGSQISIGISGRTLRGIAATQQPTIGGGLTTLATTCTQLVLTSNSANGLFVGINSATQPAMLLEFVTVEDLTLVRATAAAPLGVIGATAINNPSTGVLPAPTGIYMKWCVNAHLNRVLVAEHSNGFYLYGCVECYLENCSSLRYSAGAHAANDNVSGFYLDYTAPLGANGGNASIYLNQCRAFVGGPSYSYSAGLTTIDGFVDLFVTQLETGGGQYGIDLVGDGYSATSFRTEDCIIRGCVIDAVSLAGVRAQFGGIFTALVVVDSYVGQAGTATGIVLYDLAGSVTLANNQVIYGGAPGSPAASTGLSAFSVFGLSSTGNIYTSTQQPITINGCVNFSIADTISTMIGAPATLYPGVGVANCSRGRIQCLVRGASSVFNAGVTVNSGSSYLEVNCSGMTPTSFGSAATKIVYNGSPWGGGVTFGTGNVATGVLT